MEMWFDHTGVDDRGVHRKRARPPSTDGALAIDLTPMLDVVMIMLIFFIVAGTFVRENTVDVERKATTNQQSSEQSDNIIIKISATDEIWIKDRRVDRRSVRANISRLKASNPKASVIIKAHAKSTVNVLAKVIDSSRAAGIYNVSLSTSG